MLRFMFIPCVGGPNGGGPNLGNGTPKYVDGGGAHPPLNPPSPPSPSERAPAPTTPFRSTIIACTCILNPFTTARSPRTSSPIRIASVVSATSCRRPSVSTADASVRIDVCRLDSVPYRVVEIVSGATAVAVVVEVEELGGGGCCGWGKGRYGDTSDGERGLGAEACEESDRDIACICACKLYWSSAGGKYEAKLRLPSAMSETGAVSEELEGTGAPGSA